MLFDSTLRRELARNFGGTLVVILTIVLTVMFIRTLGQAALGRIAPQDIMLLLAYIGLGNLPTLLALSLFIAVVATLSRMYRGSEMTIWFASGVPLRRFVKPVLADSWPVLLVIAVLSLFVWPWQNERSTLLKDQFERRSDLSRIAPGQFQTSGRLASARSSSRAAPATATAATSSSSLRAAASSRSPRRSRDRSRATATGAFLVLSKGQRNEQTWRAA
jgi:lipopolysaccharide export system permease protein